MKNVFRKPSTWIMFVMALCLAFANTCIASAQNEKTTFSVCTYNVDGLPVKIIGIPVNADGKGAEGATNIGNYLLGKQYDIVGVSEDFDYNTQLTTPLADAYNIGSWRGGVSGGLPKFHTDGLNFFTKKPIAFSDEKWTSWTTSNGYFDQGNDELIDKGFRFYTVTIDSGTFVDVYIMHMDAGDSDKDIKARAQQWKQLAEAIINNASGHPIIVMGDTNSRYTRDDVEGLFVNTLNATGRLTVKDAWIELCKKGTYPTLGDDPLMVDDLGYTDGEIVDKIFYINQENGLQLTATNFSVDESADQSDHKPVVVNFEMSGSFNRPVASADWWVGEKLTDDNQAAYIYNVAFKNFISNDCKATVTDINNAPIWYFRSATNGTVDNDSERDKKDGYRLAMDVDFFGTGSAAVKSKSGATPMSFTESESTEGAYKFSISGKSWGKAYTKYFNEVTDGKYTAADTPTTQNDWLLISEEQKEAYNAYIKAFTEANKYSTNIKVSEQLKAELEDLLKTETNYNTSIGVNGTTAQLKVLTARIKAQIESTTGICIPTHTADSATVIAIYGIAGKRRPALAKGVNIVKMSDGTTKKIMH